MCSHCTSGIVVVVGGRTVVKRVYDWWAVVQYLRDYMIGGQSYSS